MIFKLSARKKKRIFLLAVSKLYLTKFIKYIVFKKTKLSFKLKLLVQSNLNSSNTDGSFTMANSNSLLNPYEILPIAQENKYLGKFSYFILK